MNKLCTPTLPALEQVEVIRYADFDPAAWGRKIFPIQQAIDPAEEREELRTLTPQVSDEERGNYLIQSSRERNTRRRQKEIRTLR